MVILRDPPAVQNGPVTAGTRDPAPVPKMHLGEAFLSFLSCGNFMLALLFYALLGITGWAFIGWMPAYLSEHFNLAQGNSGLIATGFFSIGSFIGMIVGGAWADRWSRTRAAARIWVGIIGLCVCVPSVLLFASTNVLGVAMAGIVVFGLTQ